MYTHNIEIIQFIRTNLAPPPNTYTRKRNKNESGQLPHTFNFHHELVAPLITWLAHAKVTKMNYISASGGHINTNYD